MGTAWASATINSVRLASTGMIASLGDISDSIDVLVMVSRGKQSTPAGPAHVELHFAGPTDTTLVETVETPVPLVIAHVFRVAAGHGGAGLRDGVYRAQLRLLGPSGRSIAQSIPLSLTVRGQ